MKYDRSQLLISGKSDTYISPNHIHEGVHDSDGKILPVNVNNNNRSIQL